jgi:MFS family permease
MADYGKLTGISTALAGGVGFLVSSLHSFAVQRFGYILSMRWFFILGMALLLLSAIITVSLKRINNASANDDGAVDRGELVAVFRNPDTYYLLIPNFCRGLALGVMGVIAIITISTDTMTPEETSYINIVLQAACFGANVVFALLYKKLGIARILLVSSITAALFLPFVLGGGTVLFLVLFFVTVFFRYIVDSAIPTAIAAIIPENQIGAYTAIRMLVFTGAQAIAALLITPLVSLVGYSGVLIFAAVMQLICGIGHYLVISLRHSKNPLLR